MNHVLTIYCLCEPLEETERFVSNDLHHIADKKLDSDWLKGWVN